MYIRGEVLVGARGAEVGVIVAHLPVLTRFLFLGEVASEERTRPAAVSRMRSSQMGDLKSEGNAVASSGHRGESHRCSTLTTARLTRPPWLGEETSRERPQPAVKSPTPLSQKSDIKPVGNGHGGESDRCSKLTRADTTAPVARRRSITRTAQTSGRSTYPFAP
jgi:hypothetical protein